MNITFLIGNGFDLKLGLNTRYSDFYSYYHEKASKESIILKWMKEDDDKGNWADLEMALGNKINDIDEDALPQFMDAHAEMDLLLLDYLETEQNRYSSKAVEKEILAELSRSLCDVPKELSEVEQRQYQDICNSLRNESIKYCFITFNYTEVFDHIIDIARAASLDLGAHLDVHGRSKKHVLGDVHHVHGTLNEGVVLGVNDESQINNEMLRNSILLKDIFIKSRINNQMGQRRTERAEEMINNSSIICIFGMSMGLTDKRWWERIITWLLSNEQRILIIYLRENKEILKRKIPTYLIRKREEKRQEFWEKGKGKNDDSLYERVKSRIIVVFNSKLFSFPKAQ